MRINSTLICCWVCDCVSLGVKTGMTCRRIQRPLTVCEEKTLVHCTGYTTHTLWRGIPSAYEWDSALTVSQRADNFGATLLFTPLLSKPSILLCNLWPKTCDSSGVNHYWRSDWLSSPLLCLLLSSVSLIAQWRQGSVRSSELIVPLIIKV